MVVKLFAPTVLAVLAALGLLEASSAMAQHIWFTQVAGTLRWTSLGVFVIALGTGTYASARLVRAEQGMGLLCGCGGLLGREIDGRYGYYRKCIRCSRNVNRQHYE
jgi:hypothetical protein